MTQVSLSPFAGVGAQLFDNNGVILSGGKIFSYAAGTTTPQATYTSISGATPHPNPIVLDSAGRIPGGELWIADGESYKFVVETSTGILIGTYDNVNEIAQGFIAVANHVGDGVTTIFGIGDTPSTKLATDVYINGVYQEKNTYTVSGSNITFTQAPPLGSQIEILTQQTTVLGSTSANLVSYMSTGVGAVAQTVGGKLNQINSAQDFGAVGNGVADDSVALQNAVAAKRNVILASGTSYRAKNIALSNSQSIVGNNAIFTAAPSATNIFSLSNASPEISDIRINDNANSSAAAIAVKTSRYATITDVVMINTGSAISFENNGATGCNLARLSNVDAEQITGVGVNIGSSVSEMRWVNGHLNGKINFVGGLGKPEVGSIGWRQHTPNVGLARGGHQLTSINCIGLDTGYSLHDAELTVFTSCIVDATSSYGVQMTGACSKVKFTDLFCAFTAGIYVGGTSDDIQFNGLETYNIGNIPIWGQAGWYEIAGPYYDLTVANTASVVVRDWTGSKRISVAATAKLVVDDGENYEGKSVGTVAAATTTYLGVQGQTATISDAQWRAPYDCYIIRLMPTAGTAPGVGQSFTYTALINGVATTFSSTISGTSFGGVDNWSGTLIPVSKGAAINIELVTSAGAAAARHSCILQIAPR
jgi:hypothetical protein